MAYRITDFSERDRSLMECGDVPVPEWFESDGCTWAPERWRNQVLSLACLVHDWHYHVGGTEERRRQVDRIFYRNLDRLGAGTSRRDLYYYRVRAWGALWFRYRRPTPRIARWAIFTTMLVKRYFEPHP